MTQTRTATFYDRSHVHRVRKKRPRKHVKLTLWIENDGHYFSLYHEKLSICNVCVKFHDNQSVHCWDIAFYKKVVENRRRQQRRLTQCIMLTCTANIDVSVKRLRNFCINKNKTVISREDRRFCNKRKVTFNRNKKARRSLLHTTEPVNFDRTGKISGDIFYLFYKDSQQNWHKTTYHIR